MPAAAPRSKLRRSPASISRVICSRSGRLSSPGTRRAATIAPVDGFIGELQLDSRAFQLVEHRAQRLRRAELKGEVRQLVGQRLARIVAQARDFAAAFFLDGQRFQHVVHFGGLEIQPRRFARRQFAGAFEVTHAVLVEDHLPHGQFPAAPSRRAPGRPPTRSFVS